MGRDKYSGQFKAELKLGLFGSPNLTRLVNNEYIGKLESMISVGERIYPKHRTVFYRLALQFLSRSQSLGVSVFSAKKARTVPRLS
jgi:hypothetical protein